MATHFILRGSFATSSATGDYVAVPERYGQNEDPASWNKERAKSQPSSVPKPQLLDAQWSYVFL